MSKKNNLHKTKSAQTQQSKPESGANDQASKDSGHSQQFCAEEASDLNSDELLAEFQELKQKLAQAQERERRSLADYQNLLRRTRQERSKAVKLANQDLITALLPALENLDRASQQIKDQGLDLVVDQIWNILDQFGLQKTQALGKEFDVNTMEAVNQEGEGNIVTKVVNQGYKLKDKVIQHAKVVLGQQEE